MISNDTPDATLTRHVLCFLNGGGLLCMNVGGGLPDPEDQKNIENNMGNKPNYNICQKLLEILKPTPMVIGNLNRDLEYKPNTDFCIHQIVYNVYGGGGFLLNACPSLDNYVLCKNITGSTPPLWDPTVLLFLVLGGGHYISTGVRILTCTILFLVLGACNFMFFALFFSFPLCFSVGVCGGSASPPPFHLVRNGAPLHLVHNGAPLHLPF